MLLLALMLASQALENEQSLYSPDRPCVDSTTYGMSQCMQKQSELWDKRLNAEYSAALKRASPQERPWLRRAQRLWVRYRDANCRMYSNHEGTVAQLWSAGCPLEMTKRRALELHDMD